MSNGPVMQNISIPANDDETIDITLIPANDGVTIGPGSNIFFSVYECVFGQPVQGVDPVLIKVLDHGIEITNPDTKEFTITISNTDTIEMLRNYYYEVMVVDPTGNRVRSNVGILTITGTEIR